MIQELNQDNLSELIGSNNITWVQYSAGWCGNCRIMKPKFKAIAASNNTDQFIVVDAEKSPLSRSLAQVNNLPTFAAFKNGALLGQIQTNKSDQLNSFYHEITSH